jgi:hypothetical protein
MYHCPVRVLLPAKHMHLPGVYYMHTVIGNRVFYKVDKVPAATLGKKEYLVIIMAVGLRKIVIVKRV